MPVTDIVRRKLATITDSQNQVSKDSGLNRATIRRFLAGGGLRSDQLDALCDYLGLTLVDVEQSKTTRAKKK